MRKRSVFLHKFKIVFSLRFVNIFSSIANGNDSITLMAMVWYYTITINVMYHDWNGNGNVEKMVNNLLTCNTTTINVMIIPLVIIPLPLM